jgi:hypothetical protein
MNIAINNVLVFLKNTKQIFCNIKHALFAMIKAEKFCALFIQRSEFGGLKETRPNADILIFTSLKNS